ILGLALSNGLVGVGGAVIAQYQGFADIGMGIGLILAGLASVIIGQAILGQRTILIAALAVILGSVLYRVAIQIALEAWLHPNDTTLTSAILVAIALIVPQARFFRRRRRKTAVASAPPGAAALADDGAAAAATTTTGNGVR